MFENSFASDASVCICCRLLYPVTERQKGRMKCGWVSMILTSSPPAILSSSSALILTGPLLFQHCVGSRFPCVRNHPPTCYSRQGPKTMKLYTESLWAAGRVLMKDSVTVKRITNARLLDCVYYTHTHSYRYTHKVDKHIYTLSRYRLIQPRLKGQWELECGGGWRDG